MIIPKKVHTLLEPGTYLAEIQSIEAADGQFGAQLKFTFKLLDDELEDEIQLTGWTSTNYSEKSKLFDWSRSILGPKFNPAEDCDTSKLMHRKVVLNVSQRQGTDGSMFNKIENLIHYRQPQAPKPQPAVAATEAEIISQLGFEPAPEAPSNFID